MSENGRDMVEIWVFQHRCKSVGVGERQENSSLTNDPSRTRIHALERYSKGYMHIKRSQKSMKPFLRYGGGDVAPSPIGYVGKDGGEEVSGGYKIKHK